MIEKLFLEGIGEFSRKDGVLACDTIFRGATVPVFVYPHGDESPTETWKETMRNLYTQFLNSQVSEMKKLPDFVRKICREYEMYEGSPIPWTDEELLGGMEWDNIKLTNDMWPPNGKSKRQPLVELSGESNLSPINNFTIIAGIIHGTELTYAHFDG